MYVYMLTLCTNICMFEMYVCLHVNVVYKCMLYICLHVEGVLNMYTNICMLNVFTVVLSN